MTPRHHPPEDLLVAYATGSAASAEALFVATHAALCAECAAFLSEVEALGGTLLASAPVEASPDALAAALARLDTEARTDATAPPVDARPPLRHPWLPGPLLRLFGGEPPWQPAVPGLHVAPLPYMYEGNPVMLTRLRPRGAVPRHTHHGPELQLILSGGYTADDGVFERGDAHCVAEETTHGFRVHADGPCITLLVRASRIVPITAWGRRFARRTGA
jgi:putative transcriptional regulator